MSNCPNCKRELKETSQPHAGFGAGDGEVRSGVSICPLCKEGCFQWEKDDIPGFKDRTNWPCCKCGETP